MPRIALVLGGGGIVGQAYHAGVLAGLHDATGWDPRDAELVVGTSAGAASGAELRAGLSAADMAARREGTPFSAEGRRLLRSLGPPPMPEVRDVEVDAARTRRSFRRLFARSMMMPAGTRPGILQALALPPGRLSAAWLSQQTHWLHRGEGWPERLLWTCAVDLDGGARVVFGREASPPATVGQAVEASCAIPGVFAPVTIGKRMFLDGGAWSPSNADVVAGLGLDLVIAVSPMTAVPGSLAGRSDAWVRGWCRWTLSAELARVRAQGTAVAVVEPERADLGPLGQLTGIDALDESRCPAIVAQVRRSTVERIEAGRLPGLAGLGDDGLAAAA
jgi:NTE family protein